MSPLKVFIWLSVLTVMGTISALAGSSDHPDPMKVRAALEHLGKSRSAAPASSSDAKSRPATQVSALQDFSLRGTGTQDPMPTSTTCSGVPCDASNGDCECLTFQGKLNSTQTGNATWTASITVNVDDCPSTGTTTSTGGGFCCFGDGVLNATSGSGSSTSTLAMSFTGPVCSDPNANDDTSVQGGFIVVTANSTGKFQHSAGTGQLNLFVADDLTTYLAGNGVFQLVSPF